MSSKTELLLQQRQWAELTGLEPDTRGYLESVGKNLLKTIGPQTRLAFEKGSGSELEDTPSRPAKMRALHSFSALAVNVFDSWVGSKTPALKSVLGLDSDIVSISFEEQFPTGLGGIPPNLDVALELSSGHITGIESKFSEWLAPKPKHKAPLKAKYFPGNTGLWQEKGLPESQKLAAAMDQGAEHFQHLDVPQLLKHSLGMATQCGNRFSLFYIYYDCPGPESDLHNDEVSHFGSLVGEELRFKAISYQNFFSALEQIEFADKKYLDYLRERYFNKLV